MKELRSATLLAYGNIPSQEFQQIVESISRLYN